MIYLFLSVLAVCLTVIAVHVISRNHEAEENILRRAERASEREHTLALERERSASSAGTFQTKLDSVCDGIINFGDRLKKVETLGDRLTQIENRLGRPR